MEEELGKVVKLRADDGREVELPLVFLDYFPSLAAMVADIGHLQEETVLPVSNGSGTSTGEELRWLIGLYRDYDRWLMQKAPEDAQRFRRESRPSLTVISLLLQGWPARERALMGMPLHSLLKLNLCAHYNDCLAADLLTQLCLQRRLMEGDGGSIHFAWTPQKPENRIAIADVPAWARQPLLVDYLLRAMPYARRYREILTFLRNQAQSLGPEVVQFLPAPLLQPVVRGGSAVSGSTLVVTPRGLFSARTSVMQIMGDFEQVAIEGELIAMACGRTQTMVITTKGLFTSQAWQVKLQQRAVEGLPREVACGDNFSFYITVTGELFGVGSNRSGQLGLGDANDRLGFEKVSVTGAALSATCLSGDDGDATFLLTTVGLFATGNNSNGQLGFGDQNSRRLFERVAITGTPLSVAGGYYHTMLITTEGLFACGWNRFGQLGLDDQEERLGFERVETVGAPLSVACGRSHSMLITTEGLFGCGNGSHGELGTEFRKEVNKRFLRVTTARGTPLSMACGDGFTVLLTTEGLFAGGYGHGVQREHGFILVVLPGLPLRGPPSTRLTEEEERDKKRQRLGCRLCGATSGMREELERPDRVFCSELCHRKCHYFDRVMRLS